jgi:type III secretory pathway component EscR
MSYKRYGKMLTKKEFKTFINGHCFENLLEVYEKLNIISSTQEIRYYFDLLQNSNVEWIYFLDKNTKTEKNNYFYRRLSQLLKNKNTKFLTYGKILEVLRKEFCISYIIEQLDYLENIDVLKAKMRIID